MSTTFDALSAFAAPSEATSVDTLERTWGSPRGFFGWFKVVNHKILGRRFVITGFVFFLLAGVEALLMRTQLAVPENTFVNADVYNQLFTMHGTTMLFIFAVPILEGLALYIVPLAIGARDVCFPRLSAFGYYVYLIGGVSLYAAFLLGNAPDAGWFSYVPLSGPEFSPGPRLDYWTVLVTFIEISTVTAALELIVTILKQRAPGMSLNRMPLFVWTSLIVSFVIMFAMPPLMVGSLMLELDRSLGTQFFRVAAGGDPLLWQHVFWFFGHPEVYIILLPALGFISLIIIAFTQKPIFGYTAIVLSEVSIGFLSFGLWVHHMFTTGLPRLGLSFFTAASLMIAIPTGVVIFAWIASLWGARPRLGTPLLFVLGFFFNFVLGGLTGVMVASVPFDTQVHDTFFLVAHFHYVLIGGMVFPLFGALYYWFPKFTGRLMSERAGIASFALMFIGFNVAFFPMHQLGLDGMPRRVYTYLAETGWGSLNFTATIGAYVLALGVLVTVLNMLWARRHGQPAGDNPWNAETMEWATTSPPPPYNFRYLPVSIGRDAVWKWQEKGVRPVVVGLRDDRRETITTSVLDAEPEGVTVLPGPTAWPFLTAVALAIGFIGFIMNPLILPIGLLLAIGGAFGWLWPRRGRAPLEETPA